MGEAILFPPIPGEPGPAGADGDVGPEGPQGDPGPVVPFGDLTDVDLTGLQVDDGVKWDGANWVRALFALLASPAFTGTPTAPTAADGTNTTQIATTAFVQSVKNALLNGAGGAYDTLKELQDLIVADETAATALAALVALKAPIASPAFTGNPTAPTPAPGDNDTSIATSAFVTAAVAAAVPPPSHTLYQMGMIR